MSRPEEEPDPVAEEEAEAAEAEARRIGGDVPRVSDDPAEEPLLEAGGGEAEGFELAEEDLIESASHGDSAGSPEKDASPPEEPIDSAYGEPDEEIPQDADEAIRDER